MVIRIRLRTRYSFADLQWQIALVLAGVFAPSAVLAFTICFWSFAVELGLVSGFDVTAGIFSHRQTWLVAAAVLLASAKLLASYGTANIESTLGENSNFHNTNQYYAEKSSGNFPDRRANLQA